MDQDAETELVRQPDDGEEVHHDGLLLKDECAPLKNQAQTLFDLSRLYLAVEYGRNRVLVRKNLEIVAANFPDIDVELLSPAFRSPESIPSGFYNGTSAPTTDADLDHFIRSLAARNKWITYKTLDFKSEDGRAFPALYISSSPEVATSTASTAKKLRVWIQAAVHGNEPAGDQGALALLGKMDANQAWTASLLEKLDILMLPRYNPDAVADYQRALLSGFDANRDHVKFARQQTRDIKKVFNQFSPHVAVDMHEYSATFIYAGRYQQASDGLYSAAKNLNIHPEIRRLSETLFVPSVASSLEEHGMRPETYVTGATENSTIVLSEAGSDGKIGRNAMGLTQCVAFLTESRGIGIADQQFQRRTAASLTMVESIIQTAADNAAQVFDTIQTAIADFTSASEDIIVTDSAIARSRRFPMININTGVIEQVPVRFFSTTPTSPNITRSRPEAYLIPGPWADLASRLRDSGLDVIQLSYAYHGEVEAYNVTSASFEDTYYEGVVPVSVSTEIVRRHIELEPGAFWVSTRQKNAGIAFIAIEPESVDSWVRFNIVPAGVGDQLPFFRVMK